MRHIFFLSFNGWLSNLLNIWLIQPFKFKFPGTRSLYHRGQDQGNFHQDFTAAAPFSYEHLHGGGNDFNDRTV
jgi:hypothetical protein